MSRVVVKVSLSTEERDHIDTQAKALNLSRSVLMRLRALGDPSVEPKASKPPLTVREYQGAVMAALRASNGSCSRPIVEAITAAVICAVHDSPDKQANPSHPQLVG